MRRQGPTTFLGRLVRPARRRDAAGALAPPVAKGDSRGRWARRVLGIAWIAALATAAVAGPVRSDTDDAPVAVVLQPRWSIYQEFEGPLSPLEQQFFADAALGRIDEPALLRAALIAGGVRTSDDLRHFERRVAAWVEALRDDPRLPGTARHQAQVVFEFMHAEILQGGYVRDCTDLATTLGRGTYNCVSATVLFNCLAAGVGLDVCGLEIPGHAMSRLRLPDGPLDVETTCARWFRILDDPRKRAEATQRAMGDAAEGPRRCREVTPVQVAAMIYYNRGVDLLAEQHFAEALQANAKALRLDPQSETARGNLLATLNNWAITLGTAGRFAEAASRLEQGMRIDPGYETLVGNYTHVHFQWVEQLCQQGRFAEALEVLEAAARVRPERAYFRDGRWDVCLRWARAELAADRLEAAQQVFVLAARHVGSTPAMAQQEIALCRERAGLLADQQRHAEAVRLLEGTLARHPASEPLRQQYRQAVLTWARGALEHGDYAEAIGRLTRDATPGQLEPTLVESLRHSYRQWVGALTSAGQIEAAARVDRRARTDPFLRETGDGPRSGQE